MKTFVIFLLGCLLGAGAAAQYPHPTVNNDGSLRWPADFFDVNVGLVESALALDAEINSGVPNGAGARIHWSQLLGVPAGFADGSDDGGGGGSGSVTNLAVFTDLAGLSFTVTSPTTYPSISLTGLLAQASGGTGGTNAATARAALGTDNADNLTSGTVADARIDSAILRDAEAAALYQPLDDDLNDLADGSLSGSKIGSGISGDNVTAGTVAAARIDASIARLSSPAFTDTPTTPTAAAASSNTVIASTAYVDRAVAAGGGGSPAPANATWSGLTIQSDGTTARHFRVTLTNASEATIATPSGLADGAKVLFELKQDATGGRLVALGSGWNTNGEIYSISVSTNALSRTFLFGVYNSGSNLVDPLSIRRGY